MAAAAELGPRPDPEAGQGTIPRLVRHRHAPWVLAAAFGLALILVLLD